MYDPTRDGPRDNTFPQPTPSKAQSAENPNVFYVPPKTPDLYRMESGVSVSSQSHLIDQHRTPSRNVNPWWKGWRVLLLGSWLNVLLVFVPVAWIFSIQFKHLQGFVFIFNTVALIPLIKASNSNFTITDRIHTLPPRRQMHEVATRELSLRIGGSKAGLVNASLSNVVETVVAIIALRKCELRIVQSSLIGSILSRLLLILGLCFFVGGVGRSEQIFDATTNQINSSLLIVSVGVLIFPSVYHFALSGNVNERMLQWQEDSILGMSRGVSIILMFIYVLYLVFQLVSHTHLYEELHERNRRFSRAIHAKTDHIKEKFSRRLSLGPNHPSRHAHQTGPRPLYLNLSAAKTLSSSEVTLAKLEGTYIPEGVDATQAPPSPKDSKSVLTIVPSDPAREKGVRYATPMPQSSAKPTDETPQEPQASWFFIAVALIFVTTAVAFTADGLVESMDGISKTIDKSWIALVLLPAVSSIAECSTAIGGSVKDQLTLSFNVAVGSSIQTAFFVLPLMVNVAWAMGKPLSLLFDPFDAVVLYISVQTMSHVVGDGKSNWLEGAILICLYLIIAVALWFYPGSPLPLAVGACT
ncbi:hypothetical protein AAF712_011233 [Marasmius tenuissimus]|uniref:Sodium/calcium exchanger membrane region domain-containing protein n=1 Tax=Marasmius tenuissimus TaxID=585030 RepID=A0ABR2ZLV3_9AGAR